MLSIWKNVKMTRNIFVYTTYIINKHFLFRKKLYKHYINTIIYFNCYELMIIVYIFLRSRTIRFEPLEIRCLSGSIN